MWFCNQTTIVKKFNAVGYNSIKILQNQVCCSEHEIFGRLHCMLMLSELWTFVCSMICRMLLLLIQISYKLVSVSHCVSFNSRSNYQWGKCPSMSSTQIIIIKKIIWNYNIKIFCCCVKVFWRHVRSLCRETTPSTTLKES